MLENLLMWVPSLGLKDTLEKEMPATPLCPWESPWTEEPGYTVHGPGHDLATNNKNNNLLKIIAYFVSTGTVETGQALASARAAWFCCLVFV